MEIDARTGASQGPYGSTGVRLAITIRFHELMVTPIHSTAAIASAEVVNGVFAVLCDEIPDGLIRGCADGCREDDHTAIGALGTALVGIVVLGESASLARVGLFLLIVVGIVGLQVTKT